MSDLIKLYSEILKKGASKECSYCGKVTDLILKENYVQLLNVKLNDDNSIAESNHYNSIHALATICQNCGHIELFDSTIYNGGYNFPDPNDTVSFPLK